MNVVRSSIIIIVLLAVLSSCKQDTDIEVPDVSAINVDYRVIRYEQKLTSLDTLNLMSDFLKLRKEYPAFTDLYFSRIVPVNEDEYGEEFQSELRNLVSDPRFRTLADTVDQVFSNFDSEIVSDLEKAFKNYKYYFPEFKSLDIYTLVSEYAYQQFLFLDENGQEAVGIGLDLFLGSEFPYQKIAPGLPSFSNYLSRTFNREHIVRKVVATILEDRLSSTSNRTLLDYMINNGKKLYIMKHILPETPDSIIMEYTSDQMKWVSENELAMWAFFFNESLFYETNMIKINKYVNPSPNSPGMPENAPGRTGNYMGWQIIKAYMNRYPETSLQELMTLSDAQKIMDLSKYKPRK